MEDIAKLGEVHIKDLFRQNGWEGEAAREYKETEYFVIQDLDEGDTLYLPNDFGEILDINITDNSQIYIKYADNGAEGEITIPIWFTNRGKVAEEIFSIPEKEKMIYGTHLKEPLQPVEVWDEEMSVLMFYKEGFNHWVYDWEIYAFDEDDWQLCAKAVMDSVNKDIPFFEDYYQEEMYYKRLDYYIKEIYYEDGEAVEENIVDSWDDSVWKYRSKNGEQLYPMEWTSAEIILSTGETENKYLRE